MGEKFNLEAEFTDDGLYYVTCIDLPGVSGYGDTLWEAFMNFSEDAEESLSEWQSDWDDERQQASDGGQG